MSFLLRHFSYLVIIVFRREADIEMEGSFLVRLVYDDDITYNIVEAAERVLSKYIFCIY